MKPMKYFLLAGAAALVLGTLHADIKFFWLDKPKGRDNAFDPSSPLHSTSSGPAATNTPNGTLTATPTVSPVYSPTVSPTYTNTPAGSFTASPTKTTVLTATPTATPSGWPKKYEDGETGSLAGVYVYKDASSTITLAWNNAVSHGGTASAYYQVNTVGGTWGAGGGFGTTYPTASQSGLNVIGALKIGFWIKTDQPISSYWVTIKEGNVVPGPSPLNEAWTSPAQSASASPSWQYVEIPLSSFTENMNNPDCSPNCATTGNNTLDLGNIVNFEIQFGVMSAAANVYVDDIYYYNVGANTATPTVTPTVTPFYSATATPTQVVGFGGKWYDGESAGALITDITATDLVGNTTNDRIGSVQLTTGGASGANFLETTFTATANSYFAAVDLARASTNASPYTHLQVSYRIPVSSSSDMNLMVQLVGSNAAPNDQSVPVTMAAYVYTGAVELKGQWQTVDIPLTAFYGSNGMGGTFGAADLATLKGVQVKPMPRNYNAGALAGTFDVDSVYFVGGAAPVVQTLGAGWIVDDFSSPTGQSFWGTYWFTYGDALTCATPVTSMIFPASPTAPPIDTVGGPDTPQRGLHFNGTLGAAAGTGTGTCTASQYSYQGSGISFDPAKNPVNVTATTHITSNSGNGTGLKLKIKLGAANVAANLAVTLIRVATGSGNSGMDYYAQVPTSQLSTSTWTTVTLYFPAVGASVKQGAGGATPYANGQVAGTVNFGCPSWATAQPWSLGDAIGINFGADPNAGERGKAVEYYVDDLLFF